MHRRVVVPIVAFALCWVALATAAPLDQSATKKIDEAVNEHYLATDFKKAEGVLLGVVKACADKCSPPVLARAWMYIGLVRGSGKEDLPGAREAFTYAIAADPAVKLDDALATPETRTVFDEVAGSAGGAAPPAAGPPTSGAAPSAAPSAAAGMLCGPNVAEVQTRRPIPVACAAPPTATKVDLLYKVQGVQTYRTVAMSLAGGQATTVIPCLATSAVGQLEMYAVAKDASGTPVAQWNSADRPTVVKLVEETSAPPPTLPGETAPERCKSDLECPPGLPGCAPEGGGGWGDSCTPAEPCKLGLYCKGGLCEPAPECAEDGDCESGVCAEGYCKMDEGGETGASTGYKKNWIGLHVAGDFAIVSGTDVCAMTGWNDGFRCFDPNDQMLYAPGREPPGSGATTGPSSVPPFWVGDIATTAKYATTRILLSYDRAFTPNITVGIRGGIAFGGAPSEFFPYHAELRGTFWVVSLAKQSLRPYVSVGGGMAQVDAGVEGIYVLRATGEGDDPNAQGQYDQTNGQTTSYTAYKRMGQGFAALALGAVMPIGSMYGLQVNLNGMYMLPSSGLVIEPSLGFLVGF